MAGPRELRRGPPSPGRGAELLEDREGGRERLPSPTPAPEPAPPSPDQPTVSLLTPAAVTVGKGQRYKVVGIVRPAKGNLRVQRQKLVGDVWKTLDTDTTNAKGRYRFVIRDAGRKAPGTYRILVLRKGSVLGVSPEFGVTLS